MYETFKTGGQKNYKKTLDTLTQTPDHEIEQKVTTETNKYKDHFLALVAPVIEKNHNTKPGAPKVIFTPVKPL